MVRAAVMTPADVHDSVPADGLVQGDERAVYADKAYDGERRRAGLRERGIEPRIMHKARRNRPLKPWQMAFNKAVAPIRAGVERLFATMKRTYGHRRVRYLGVARRRPAAGPVRRHQSAPGARPRAGLRGGVGPMWTGRGEEEPNCRWGRHRRSLAGQPSVAVGGVSPLPHGLTQRSHSFHLWQDAHRQEAPLLEDVIAGRQ